MMLVQMEKESKSVILIMIMCTMVIMFIMLIVMNFLKNEGFLNDDIPDNDGPKGRGK